MAVDPQALRVDTSVLAARRATARAAEERARIRSVVDRSVAESRFRLALSRDLMEPVPSFRVSESRADRVTR